MTREERIAAFCKTTGQTQDQFLAYRLAAQDTRFALAKAQGEGASKEVLFKIVADGARKGREAMDNA